MAEEPIPEQSTAGKPGGVRSVSFPFIPLETALGRAKEFWDNERKNAAPVSAAAKHWGYGLKSSGGRQTVSALIQFGLMTDEGSKADRMVRLTDQAIDLIIMPPDDPRRKKLIQAAARSPKIYAELLSKWPELPSDHTLAYFLQKDKNFNPNSVAGFISDFKATVRYADLDQPDTLSREESGSPVTAPTNANKPPKVRVGDFVQWTSGGVDQLPLPRRVTGISDEGKYAFVEGAQAGLPIEELTVMAEPRTNAQPPLAGVPAASGMVMRAVATKQDVFSLDEGQVVLQWPDSMSPDSYEDFKAWIELQVRKIGRSVQ